jgi:hypothetical protein
MTDFTQDLFARRRNVADGNTRVVSEGRLWYDSITNTIRVSDGHTPGGQIVTGQAGAYTLPTATPSVKGGVQLGANIVASGATIDVLQPTRVSQLENDSNYLSGAVLATYATQTFVTTQGYITSAALSSGNANVVAANSTIQSISANLGAYQSYANTNISTLTSNAGVQGASINRIDANVGAYQTWANVEISSRDANIGTLSLSNISTQANLGAYQIWANGRITTLDANIGTLSLGNISTQSNLGAYQTWANGRVTTLDANLGTATTNISNLVTQANANTAAYLTTYTGNVSSGNLNVGSYSNLYITTGSLTNRSALTISGNVYGRGGVGYLDAVQLTNNYSAATNPNKYIRVNPTGGIEIINSAYTTTLLSLSDAGVLNVSGSYQVAGKQAVNGPAFRAYIAGSQTITSGSQQRVTFGSETFDTNSNFASSTFTPTVEGYYQLNATVRISGSSGLGEIMLTIWKNGSEYARGTNEQGTEQGNNFYSLQVSDLVYANGTTDYFEIYIQQTTGGNRDTTAGQNISYFSGAMVRGA